MPTYEYQCVSCGHRFEKFQSFSAEPIKECPVCGEPVKKVIAPAGIIFKGSGWYITDSKKTTTTVPAGNSEKKTDSEGSTEKAATGDAAKPAETAPAASNANAGASAEKKSDSKPADNKSSAA